MYARDGWSDYTAAGPSFHRAWLILSYRCDVPPSIEVFEHELELRKRNLAISPENLARQLAENYKRLNV